MLARVNEVAAELKANPPPLPADEIAEAIEFLQWVAADNFTLLGARDYAITDSESALEPEFETGLGLLRSPEMRLLRRGNQLVTITPEIREFLKEPKLIIMTKAAARSRVHRRVYLDYIGVKYFDHDGKLVGECVFCGLFTSTAYTRSVHAIPYLRRKVDHVIRRAGFDPGSHSGKALVNVLETLSARRIVPDRRRDALSLRAGDSYSWTNGRACAYCRGATASTASSRSSSTFRASATTARSGRGSAIISPPPSKGACAPSIRFSRKVRWCASISSSGATKARRPSPIAPLSIARSKPSSAAGSTACMTRSSPRPDPAGGACAVRPLRRRVSDRLPRGLPAGGGGRRHPRHRGADRRAPAGRRALPRAQPPNRRAPGSRS